MSQMPMRVKYRKAQRGVVRGRTTHRKYNGPIKGNAYRGIERDGIERGQVLAKLGSITPHTKFATNIYMLSKDEDGRHRPFFKGCNITKTESLDACSLLVAEYHMNGLRALKRSPPEPVEPCSRGRDGCRVSSRSSQITSTAKTMEFPNPRTMDETTLLGRYRSSASS